MIASAIAVNIIDVTTDHFTHQQVMIERRHICMGADMLTVAEDGDRIAHLKHFLHAMGDIEHYPALIAQSFDNALELSDLLNGEATGGLIESDDLGVTQQCAANFDHLLLSYGEVAHLG